MIRNISLVLFVLFSLNIHAQTDKKTTTIMISEKNYVFVATSAIPTNSTDLNNVLNKMNGSGSASINLAGSSYDLKITPDSVIAYLPYYGRAYTAPIGNDDNGIKFTSTKFVYESKKSKKNWQITILIKDSKNGEKLYLNISENGYASLNISSNTKQNITFNGYIEDRK